MDGWNPRFNAQGEIASGSREVWFAGRSLGPGRSPQWLTDDLLLIGTAEGDETILLNVRTGEESSVKAGYNVTCAGGGVWLGWTPATITSYQGLQRLGGLANVAPPTCSRSGRYRVWLAPYNADQRSLILDTQAGQLPITSGPILDYSVSDQATVWSQASGRYTRGVAGRLHGAQADTNLSLLDWESPIVVDAPDGPWILSVTQTGLIFRPWGESFGYRFDGDYYTPDCLWLDNRFLLASCSRAGAPQLVSIRPSDPRVDLTLQLPVAVRPIGRPCWLGWFEFKDIIPSTPRNCDLPTSDGILRTFSGAPIAVYTAAESEGTPEALERAIRVARARYRLPVIAYWPPGSHASGPVPSAEYVGVPLYPLKGEPLADFTRRSNAALARCPRAALIAHCSTGNIGLSTDLAALVPIYAQLAIDHQNVSMILPFSAGNGRKFGYDDHPEVWPLWTSLLAGIPSTPAILVLPSEPEEPESMPQVPPPASNDQFVNADMPAFIAARQEALDDPTWQPDWQWAVLQQQRRYGLNGERGPSGNLGWSVGEIVRHELAQGDPGSQEPP